jgi:hypothetical protein
MVYLLIQERLHELYNNREVHLEHRQQVGVYHLDTLVIRQEITISLSVPCF